MSEHGDGQGGGRQIGQVRGQEGQGEGSSWADHKGAQGRDKGSARWVAGEGRKKNGTQIADQGHV